MIFFNFRVFIKDQTQQEERETMKSEHTEFAAIKLPTCLVGGGAKVEWGGQKMSVHFDELVAPSTRELNAIPDDPQFMT